MAQMRSYDDVQIVLSTLAAGVTIKGNLKIDGSREQGVRISKMKAACGVSGEGADLGPLLIGLCNADLSPTEISECLSADPQKDLDTPASEEVMREIMPIWLYPIQAITNSDVNALRTLQSIRYPWKEVIEGNGLAWFVTNLDETTLAGGGLVDIFSVTIGEWLRD